MFDNDGRVHAQSEMPVRFFHVTRQIESPSSRPVEAMHILPRILDPSHASPRTREAEKVLDLPPSIYFFAGHACPSFGNIALVFGADLISKKGSASPFDSGGLAHKKIKIPPEFEPPGYFQVHVVRLSAFWRRFFDYVATHFSSIDTYLLQGPPQVCGVQGRPAREPCNAQQCRHEFRFKENAHRHAWTWELQLHGDHRTELHLERFHTSREVYQRLESSYKERTDEEWTWWMKIASLYHPCDSDRLPAACAEAETRNHV